MCNFGYQGQTKKRALLSSDDYIRITKYIPLNVQMKVWEYAYLKLYSKSLPPEQCEFHSQITVVKVDIDVITVLNGKENFQNVYAVLENPG